MTDMNAKSGSVVHAHPFLRRLTGAGTLSEKDITLLMDAQRNRIKVGAGRDLVRAGQPATSTYVVQSGWFILHCLFDDGRRQIYALALPGDVIGEFAPYRAETTYNVTALTSGEVAALNSAAFLGLKDNSLAIAHALGTNSARDTSILGDQIIRLGRLSAYERHCHLMLEIWHRCHEIGEVQDGWIDWPLKQVDMADILGLSLVHVNRTVMQLKRDGLITLEKRRLRLNDPEKMAELSGFEAAKVSLKAA